MLRGELYLADDPELVAGRARPRDLLDRYNSTRHDEKDERRRLLSELLGDVGDDVTVMPTFRCDCGSHISIGSGTFCPGVTIGDDTVVGAGAVITRDLPAGVVALGVPAVVHREIG